MKHIGAIMTRTLPVILASISALLAGAFLPPQFLAAVTQELIALFGLMMAAVLPAMTLTATALRSGNLSRKRIDRLYLALRQQLDVWFGMFALSFLLCSCVVLGKIVDWSLLVPLPFGEANFINLARVINAVIVWGGVLFVLRVGAVGRGVLSILKLSHEIAVSEAVEAQNNRHQKIEEAISAIKPPDGRGAYVELPGPPT